MTISSETTRNRYEGNGLTTVFAYTFKVVDEDHLSVLVADANDLATTLVVNVDYTVSGIGDDAGGNVTVTTAVASGSSISILRSMPLLQSTDFENQGGFFADTHEDSFDALTMMAQQQQEELDRSVKVSETSGLGGDDMLEQLDLYEASCAASAAAAESSATDAETAQTGAETAQTGAETAETGAETAETAAEIALAATEDARDETLDALSSAGLPESILGEAGKILSVKTAEDGYELVHNLFPPGFIKGFVPEYKTGGTTLEIGGGSCVDHADTINMRASSLGEKDLMATWAEGFGPAVGSMVGGYGKGYDQAVAMTAAALPSGEMAFATSKQTNYEPYEAFNNRGDISYNWMTSTAPSVGVPQYLGRKNNIGVIKNAMIQSPSYFSPAPAENYGNWAPVDFEFVGTNDTITDQTSFNAATWTTILAVTGSSFKGQGEKQFHDLSSNTTDWAWVGIKITQGSGLAYTGVQNLVFSNDDAINEIKPMKRINTYGDFTSHIDYHCFVLYNPITFSYDWCVETDINGANIANNTAISAAGYTKFRRVFSFTGNEDSEVQRFMATEVSNGGINVEPFFAPTDINRFGLSTSACTNQMMYSQHMPWGISGELRLAVYGSNVIDATSRLGLGSIHMDMIDSVSYLSMGTLRNRSGYSLYEGTSYQNLTTEAAIKAVQVGADGNYYFAHAGYSDFRND